MEKDRVLALLQTNAPEIKAAGVLHLHLFGSVARGEATAQSDVDLIAVFNPSHGFSRIGIGSLQVRLTELPGTEVERTGQWMHERVCGRALKEAVLVS